MIKEGLNLIGAEIPGMLFVVEVDEAFDPMRVGCLGFGAEVSAAASEMHAIEQFGTRVSISDITP